MTRRLLTGMVRWELLLLVLIVAAMAWSATLSPYYLYLDQILASTRFFVLGGLMALGLMIIVVQGEIDISLASTLAVSTTLLARLDAAGWPPAAALPVVLVCCALLGCLNGVLVARFGLPSLAVTLGTLGAFRGLAYVLGGQNGYSSFATGYSWVGSAGLGIVPVSLVLFLLLAVLCAVLMRGTVFGRYSYAIGNNVTAATFGGVQTVRTKIISYALAGALAGLAGLVWVGQYASARADNADGQILFVVTAVVLGGVSIHGGKGTVLGVVLSLFLLGTLNNGMGLANVPGPTQTLVLGTLLVLSIGIPRGIALARSTAAARRRRREATAHGAASPGSRRRGKSPAPKVESPTGA